MSLHANKLYHEAQAHRFAAEGDRALDREFRVAEPVQHIGDYYRRKCRAHAAAWRALVLSEAGEG